jgi:predicted MPP superfamily phosphohydrolase
MRASLRALTFTAVASGAAFGYASVIERNWFALRRFDVPVLAPGSKPVRVLHLSDVHLTPGRHRLLSWIRSLDTLAPDLVVNTGDSISDAQSVQPLLQALEPLLARPGVFVFGSNDLYSPVLANPLRYFWMTHSRKHLRRVPDLPWEELGAGMKAAGWMDANNARGWVRAAGLDVEVGGVHDPHIDRDDYSSIAGPTDPSADLRLGVLHSPEPRVMDRFAADGYDLLLSGHTHGGQLCMPVFGPLVTNCGIERERARGLHRHPSQGDPDRPWLHVSAGLGTSPWTPGRFCCRPEASLLTLVPGSANPKLRPVG